MLGEIPFEVWQCLAELADNSLDAFNTANERGIAVLDPRINMHWSTEDVPKAKREIVVQDNGPGVTLDDIQKAVKAGFTTNDPMDSLGLFGMGFNIATAALGDETEFLSLTEESDEWVGVRIAFAELIEKNTWETKSVRRKKEPDDISGTKVIVRALRESTIEALRSSKKRVIRTRLENLYTPILEKGKVQMFLDNHILLPRPQCVWSKERSVTYKPRGLPSQQVPAKILVDEHLGERFFDTKKMTYASSDEASEYRRLGNMKRPLPEHVKKRSCHLHGWVGIQRYCHPNDFGLDFIRNGRVILRRDRSLFTYEDPETGDKQLEYPLNLGTSVGGRIVGELHVDYLRPVYTKNEFERTDELWFKTLQSLRGTGPILYKSSREGNTSPLGLLMNAYSRVDQGTKCLCAPRPQDRNFFKKFQKGDVDYRSDEKWFKAAQEHDKTRSEGGKTTPPSSGTKPSEDTDQYDDGPTTEEPSDGVQPPDDGGDNSHTETSERNDLLKRSEKIESDSANYAYGSTAGVEVTVYKVGPPGIKWHGKAIPTRIFGEGITADFFYDETHKMLREFPITYKQLLLQGLVETFRERDVEGDPVTDEEVFRGLINKHLAEERLSVGSLHERADELFDSLKEELPEVLKDRWQEVAKFLKDEAYYDTLLENLQTHNRDDLLQAYIKHPKEAVDAFAFVPSAAIPRLIQEFPENFLDNKVFAKPYTTLKLNNKDKSGGETKPQRRSVDAVVRRVIELLRMKDTVSKSSAKNEILLYDGTLKYLLGLRV
jgi:hypothetical protein